MEAVRGWVWIFSGIAQSERMTQYQEMHSMLNKKNGGMALFTLG